MRSFLLTVHEPGSVVLEDLRTRRRMRVELSEVPARVAEWLAEPEPAPPVVTAGRPDWTGSTSAPGPAP
jgi:hypothetical protein